VWLPEASVMIATDFADVIAARMQAEHRALAARWFERLLDLLPVDARDVFPTESLLDHVPALILEISGYLRQPEEGAIAANTAIMEKARELGALRHGQRASLHQVLREYQVLGGVLVTFVLEEMERLSATPPPAECALLVSRLHQAVNVLSQSTVETFVTLYTQTIAEQNERLEQFTRMAAHEWRQPLGAVQFGVSLLRGGDMDPGRAERTLAAVDRNVQHLVELTRKLEALARMHSSGDNAVVQEVSAGAVAQEAARQLREMADARGVEIQIGEDLPTLTVDVGRLELVLMNLLSNAIKYSDPEKPRRHVVVSAAHEGDVWCRIEVSDNGVGIPEPALATIFQRFTRAHADRDDLAHVTGVGLGLSIAEDCTRAMSGHIDVRSVEHEGTVFSLTLPRTPVPPNHPAP
jgi:signal transduction histidine kinase